MLTKQIGKTHSYMESFKDSDALPNMPVLLDSTWSLQTEYELIGECCNIPSWKIEAITKDTQCMSNSTALRWILVLHSLRNRGTTIGALRCAVHTSSPLRSISLPLDMKAASDRVNSISDEGVKLSEEQLETILRPHESSWYILGALCGVSIDSLHIIQDTCKVNRMSMIIKSLTDISESRVKHAVSLLF